MNRKIVSMVVLAFLFSAIFAMQFVTPVRAEETAAGDDSSFGEAYFVDAVGTYFEITNSTYLNVTLTSTEIVHVILESVPRTVSYIVESNSSATSTVLTFGGFQPDATYYRYQDGELVGDFTTDSSGGYTYTQEMSEPHHILIQENASSTIYITSDTTFTHDIYETIVVAANDIVIDGNGYTLQGPFGGYPSGFYLWGRSGVTIKNCTIEGFRYGVYLGLSSHNTISENTLLSNSFGIYLHYSSDTNKIIENVISDNGLGIYLYYSAHNTISGNSMSNNAGEHLALYYSNYNVISDNTASIGSHGFFLRGSGYNTMTRNNMTNNGGYGIILDRYCSSNTITNNTMSNNYCGMYTYYSSGNTIYHNNFIHNIYEGISAYSTNTWDNGYPSGGNYWSDYEGEDLDGDGIGDTSYTKHGITDRYPFMQISGWFLVPPPNYPPYAFFRYYPHNPTVGEEMTFDATTGYLGGHKSYDPDGTIVSYEWNFGDGGSGAGGIVSHSYSRAGVYTAELTVTDDDGVSSSHTKTVVVTSDEYKNIALNPTRTGYPHPLESDSGWGGGGDKWDIVDGNIAYPVWYNGLAFTGGWTPYVAPAGWRQATINFGEEKTFDAVRIWHHGGGYGSSHTPAFYKIQYWDGSNWVDVYSTTTNSRGRGHETDALESCWYVSGSRSTGITDKFDPVTSSKIRLFLTNLNTGHGWIWQFEVFGGVIPIDTTPPETTISLNGTLGLERWWVSDVTVTLTANDDISGVAETAYSFDGATWMTYTEPFTITEEGIITVYYNSTDVAGNVEATKTETIKIDKTPPTTDLTIGTHYVDGTGNIYVTSATEFTLTPTDAVSGVAHTYYRINNGDWIEYVSAFKLAGPDGTYTIDYYSIDVAGNQETQKSATVIPVSLKVNSYLTDSDFNPITYFDLVFVKHKSVGYKLVATNPGQFYYNIEATNDWPIAVDTLTIDASIPTDFVLKGAVPIHVYLDGNDITDLCTTDGNKITVTNVPSGSKVYVTIHVDYALKYQYTGIIYDTLEDFGLKGYTFAVIVLGSGSAPGGSLVGTYTSSATLSVHQKKTTAIAGFVTDASGNPIIGATVELFNSNDDLVGTTVTDESGFYYFLDIPAGDYTIQVTYNGETYSQTATAVAKELTQVDFKIE